MGQTVLDESFEEASRNPASQWKALLGDRSFYETARSNAQESLGHSRFFDPDEPEKAAKEAKRR
jgi:hypothetical protein